MFSLRFYFFTVNFSKVFSSQNYFTKLGLCTENVDFRMFSITDRITLFKSRIHVYLKFLNCLEK